MKHSLIILGLIIVSCGLAQNASAVTTSNSGTSVLQDRLEKMFGDSVVEVSDYDQHLKFVLVDSSHFFFVTHDGTYIFDGSVIDTQRNLDIVYEKKSEHRKTILSEQPKSLFVKFPSIGDSKSQLTVFTDIDCPYCRQFHNTVNDLNQRGVSINYVMLPRAGKQSASYAKTLNALCSKNPAQSITRAMRNEDLLPEEQCNATRLNQQMALAKQLGIEATPTFLFPSGDLQVGVPSVEKLMSLLGTYNK